MNEIKKFREETKDRVARQAANEKLKTSSVEFFYDTLKSKYSYNFNWMGRPIIQYPQDIVAMQEIIWEVKPDLIIETGIAHGGSIIFYASMLELIGNGEIIGIDIDIREHNKKEIESHSMFKRITMIQGSSISPDVVNHVRKIAETKSRIMVILDSNHTHDHVKYELELYSDFVSKDSYLVVFDTIVEDMPDEMFFDRPWGKGNNPKTAVWDFLKNNNKFEIDKTIQDKLLITVSPDGYLKRVK